MKNRTVEPDVHRTPSEVLVPRKNDVLAEICQAIARSANHREVVQDCAERLQRYFGTTGVLIFFQSGGDLVLEGLAIPDHLQQMAPGIQARWGHEPADPERPSVQAMRRRQILRWDISDPSLAVDTRMFMERGGARTVTVVPIYVDGDPIGACSVATPQERPLNAADEALMETALGVVGIVFQRGVLQELESEHQRNAIRAHQLAAVGELAAGVAHEINNPLSTIVHFSQLLLEHVSGEQREQVWAILEEALRAASTVRNLQIFARQESDDGLSIANVSEAIQAIVDLEQHQLAVSNVDVRVELAPDLPPVQADPANLRRVLYNLMSNARHAIHQAHRGGQIVLSGAKVGPWVEIAVEDTGTGLTPEVADAMFRPFFTTRASGEGAGLGLAVAYGMIREHGGELIASNWGLPPCAGGEPGEGGARIVVRLPAAEAPAVPDAPAAAQPAAPAHGLSILIVEDELQVARSVAALLIRDGHFATISNSAEEAIEVLGESGPTFDVILSDFRMPGMGGEGLYDWLRTHHPDWMDRLLFTSGDLLSPRTQAFLAETRRPVLPKPYTLETLREAIAPFARKD